MLTISPEIVKIIGSKDCPHFFRNHSGCPHKCRTELYVIGCIINLNCIGHCDWCSVSSDYCDDVQADWEDRTIEGKKGLTTTSVSGYNVF